MEEKAYKPAQSYSEKYDTPIVEASKQLFDKLLKYGKPCYYSDLTTNGATTMFIVPKNYTFFLLNANSVGFGTASGAFNGLGITGMNLTLGYSSDFIVTSAHAANQGVSNSINFSGMPLMIRELSEFVNFSVGANNSNQVCISGYIIETSQLQ